MRYNDLFVVFISNMHELSLIQTVNIRFHLFRQEENNI